MECDELVEPEEQPEYDDDEPEDDEWSWPEAPIRGTT